MSEGIWKVEIKSNEDETIYRFMYSPNIPLPGIGYVIWLPVEPYKGRGLTVENVHIGYDDRVVTIQVSE